MITKEVKTFAMIFKLHKILISSFNLLITMLQEKKSSIFVHEKIEKIIKLTFPRIYCFIRFFAYLSHQVHYMLKYKTLECFFFKKHVTQIIYLSLVQKYFIKKQEKKSQNILYFSHVIPLLNHLKHIKHTKIV